MAERPLHRRDFMRQSLRGLVRTVADTVDATLDSARRQVSPGPPRLRPPGALPEAEFLGKCTSCDECIRVCPAQCIGKVPSGQPDAGTPLIVAAARACVLCSDLACTHVCEPGALTPLQGWAEVAIGLAEIHRGQCVAFSGEACTICHDVCPTEPRAIQLEGGRPRVRAEVCTGCGLCEERCPTRPRAVRVAPPLASGTAGSVRARREP